MIGVLVTFTQTEEFDRSTVAKIAGEARGTFEGMPAFASRASHSTRTAFRRGTSTSGTTRRKPVPSSMRSLVDRVTGLYGVAPKIEFLEILEFVDNSDN